MNAKRVVIGALVLLAACAVSFVIGLHIKNRAFTVQQREIQEIATKLQVAESQLVMAKTEVRRATDEANMMVEQIQQDNLMNKAVRDYYNTIGMWSGIFYISDVVKAREVAINDYQKELHLRYEYAPIPNNRTGRTDVGFDQRIFYLQITEDGSYQVTKMGDAGSAIFPDEEPDEPVKASSQESVSF